MPAGARGVADFRRSRLPTSSPPLPPPPSHGLPLQVINDLETLWEVPANPKGVLFVAHGCNHQGSDFWLPSPRCRHCLGLPEEGVVRATALKRGYAVVAVTSFNRDSKCWHNTQPSRSEDLKVGGRGRASGGVCGRRGGDGWGGGERRFPANGEQQTVRGVSANRPRQQTPATPLPACLRCLPACSGCRPSCWK